MSLEDRLYPLLGLYQGLPEKVQSAVGTAYRCLPRRWRWGAAYGEFRRLSLESSEWSDEELEAYQLKQLRKVLHHASAYCPFYQKTFAKADFRPELIQSTQDLQKCPLLEKSDLQNHLDEMTSSNVPTSKRLYITTGGSTGVPVGFYLQKGISRPKEQAFLECMWKRAGYEDNDRLVVIRGHVTSSRSDGGIRSLDTTRNWLMLSSYHMTHERMPEYLEAIEQFQPDMLHIYPSAALLLADYLEKYGQSLRVPLKGLLCGSERMTLPQKRMLERVFQCRVYRWYGHAERAVLAGEGTCTEKFYFFPHYGLVEFGPPDEAGLQEVIGTSFHNVAMPLIRYRTGDYVRLSDSKASDLEYPWPAADEIVGRGQDYLVAADGRLISLTAFNMHDGIFDGLYAVQFFQEEKGMADFRYIAGPDFKESRLAEIHERIREKLGQDFEVRFQSVDEVEKKDRGKHRWLVSRMTKHS